MRILEYAGIDTARVRAQYEAAVAAIGRGDFRAAEVKKLTGPGGGKFYRARLSDADRLLFALVRHGAEVCALMLEVIENHAYARSRFLRGAVIDEAKMFSAEADVELAGGQREAQALRYLHPRRPVVHLQDKPISFDDAQEAVYHRPPPLILIGGAGSGKTALVLEKLKQIDGEVLYVTRSAYLARGARDLYYAQGFERAGQEATFLSYREFVESVRVPAGREAQWRDFAAWFARMRQQFRDLDAHQAFEEIRGVVGAQAEGVLSREAYAALGVRQSIFGGQARERLYDLFGKYRQWLGEAGLYDLNLVAHAWLALASPRYAFIVIDEVQDITPVELALVLKTLERPGQFLLCGDANQIVHPNFFSWAGVRALFWRDPVQAAAASPAILSANFRNGVETTRVANTLIKIRPLRFGSVDRDSNHLVEAVGGSPGRVALMPEREADLRELDRSIRQSTRHAVLVMREEDKAAARRHFATPLLFSVQEAKGLEYENIVLYRMVSDHRAEFAAIAEGVDKADLAADSLEYRRARDKTDKSLEVYKFFVNALYVALTRAVENLYLVESDTAHPLFGLLDLAPVAQVRVAVATASREEWQMEARKLELQGKAEQAQAIRATILRQAPVPWPVTDEARLRESLVKVFREQVPGAKPRQQLYDYAGCHEVPALAARLAAEAGFAAAAGFTAQRAALGRKHFMPYYQRNIKDVLRLCDVHGAEHRLAMDVTPLIAAAHAGNVALVEALLERGADIDATDHYGCSALHWALREAFRDPRYARETLSVLYPLIAPPFLDVRVADRVATAAHPAATAAAEAAPAAAGGGGRLVRIDRHLAEYLLMQTLWALFKSRFAERGRQPRCAFETEVLLAAWEHLPANVLAPERKRRQYLSSVLARNEVARDYAYNRALFLRVAQGWYQFNPALAVRRRADGGEGAGEAWTPIFAALNLPLINEMALDLHLPKVAQYAAMGGLPAPPAPIAGAAARARARANVDGLERQRLEWVRLEQARARLRRVAAKKAEARRRVAQDAKAKAALAGADAGTRTSAAVAVNDGLGVAAAANNGAGGADAADAAGVTQAPAPPWGTPAARQLEIERIRQAIAARKK